MSLTFAINFGSLVAFTCDPSMFGRGFGVSTAFMNIFMTA